MRTGSRSALPPRSSATGSVGRSLLAALLVGACADSEPPASVEATLSSASDAAPAADDRRPGRIGDPLPGTDIRDFAESQIAFAAVEDIEEGLGPIFNGPGCGACHSNPVVGGSGDAIERRFGRIDGGVFFGYDTEPDNQGGTLRQRFSVGTYSTEERQCTIPVEVEPDDANVNDVGRRTTPLFGLGLVDAMPDAFFDRLAARQPPSVRGVARRVSVALPDPRDPSQSIGSTRVGRFGWKGQVPSLLVFSADAYTNEMGVTTQSCFEGSSVVDFAQEHYPNNVAPPQGCNGGDLAPRQPAHADVPEFTDDAVGPCTNGRTEIQDDLLLFTHFMESLAPPTRDLSAGRVLARGERHFNRVGCADCHVSDVFRTPRRPFNGVPGNYGFRPFSDFLVHDMGSLGDGIAETGDPVEATRLMRTAPLWGARFNTNYLHDGRASTIGDAILAHDGQGAAARDAFMQLDERQRSALVAYVLSL